MIMVAGAGILSTSENTENARRFLEFMLSPVGQQYFTSQTYEYPLVEGVKTHFALVSLEEINNQGIPVRDLPDLEGTQNLLRDSGVIP